MNGLRSFAKMSAHDFGVTIAIGSILGSSIIQETPSIFQAGWAIACLLICQSAYSAWRRKRPRPYLENSPMLLMDGSNILEDNMKMTNISKDDLFTNLRKANVSDLNQVKAVILETSGDISVIHNADNFDETLLYGVKKTVHD